MTGTDVVTFPGSVAVIAAIVLVVATFTAGVFAIVDYLARTLTDKH